MLSIPDIETMGVLAIKYNTIHRQLASDDKANKTEKLTVFHIEGRKFEGYVYNM